MTILEFITYLNFAIITQKKTSSIRKRSQSGQDFQSDGRLHNVIISHTVVLITVVRVEKFDPQNLHPFSEQHDIL